MKTGLNLIGSLLGGAVVLTLGLARSAEAPAGPPPLFEDEVLAKGKGFEIRQSEVDEMVSGLRATLAVTRNQTIPEQQRELVAGQMLDRLVMMRIVRERATEADRTKAAENAAKFLADTRAKAKSEDAYRRQLLATGIKADVFERRAGDQALLETVLDRELKPTVTVTDAQVQEFHSDGVDVEAREVMRLLRKQVDEKATNTVTYRDGLKRLDQIKKANLNRLDRPATVKAQVLVLHTVDRVTNEELPADQKADKKRRAEQLIEKVRAGEDFTQIIRGHSDDLEAEKTGGEYSVARNGIAFPELELALFSLPIGQLSDLIATRVGYYVVRVIERTEGGKAPFEKSKNDLRELLTAQEVQKKLPAYFEQIKKEYAVEYVKRDR